MKCRICGSDCEGEGEGEGDTCPRHAKAEEKLKEHFEIWHERAGLGWREYLEALVRNEATGEWIREVARHMLSSQK